MSPKPHPLGFSLSRFTSRAAMLAALAMAGGAELHAATFAWDKGGGDFSWGNAANWNPDGLPTAADTVTFSSTSAGVFGAIALGGIATPRAVSIINLSGNTSGNYSFDEGVLIGLTQINQTADDANVFGATVTITTANSGAGILSSNVTVNQLQLQGQVVAGGVIKTGGGELRFGTSGTAFNGAVAGDITINGGTFHASADNESGVNNPLASSGNGTINAGDDIIIGANGVTLKLTHSRLTSATAAVTYDWGRDIRNNGNSFTLNTDRAAGSANAGIAQVGTIYLSGGTMSTTNGNGFTNRADGYSLASGTVSTVSAGVVTRADSLQGNATTKLVKAGTSELRILSAAGSPATDFRGDIDISAGTLVLEANSPTGQPLGAVNSDTQINIVNSGVTLSLRTDENMAMTFNNTNIVAGNNSFSYDVRNISATNSQTMVGGKVTIGNATMTVVGDRHNLRISELNVIPGSELTQLGVGNSSNGAQNLRIDSLTGGGSGSILRKNGGQTLTITASAGGYTGDIEHTGGTLIIEAAAGLIPTANVGTITLNNSNTFNLRAADSVDFGSNIVLGPNVKNQTITVDRTGSAPAQQLRVGTIDISPSATLGERTLTLNGSNSFTHAADGILTTGAATLVTNADTTIDAITAPTGAILTKRGGANLTVASSNLATFAGTLDIRAGSLTGNVAGAFGASTVLVGDPVANSAGFMNNFSRVHWSAVGAGQAADGPDVIARAGGAIDLNVTPAATDRFEVQALGRIQGSTAQLAALTVGTNLTLAEDAIIIHDNPSSAGNTVSNLAAVSEKSIYYGLAANATSLPTIGAGTPWKGIAGTNSTGVTIQGANGATPAVINIAGGDGDSNTVEAYFQGMNDQAINIGANGLPVTWSSTAAGGEKVTLGIRGTLGTSGLGLVPGGRVMLQLPAAATNLANAVDKIIVENGTLGVMTLNGLGGVPVEVRNNGSLDINDLAGVILDGPVTIKSGGVLYLNDNKLLGSSTEPGEGTITIENGGKLDLAGSSPTNIFTGSAANGQAINFTGSGHTVRFAANGIVDLDATVPNAGVTYVVQGGTLQAAAIGGTTVGNIVVNTQAAGLTLENGVLTNDGTTRSFVGQLTLNNTNLTVAATRGTSFVVQSAVNTTGNVQIGSHTAIDGRDKSSNSAATNWAGVQDPYNSTAQVVFTEAFSAGNVDVQNSHLAFSNQNTTITGNLTIDGGVLHLDGGGQIAAGDGAGLLTGALKAGTFASKIITGANTRIEMKLNPETSNGSRTEINQAFVIGGDINPQDNRTMWVSRNVATDVGTDTGINFNNITLLNGAVFGVQEDNTDVRVNLKLAGNAIASTPSSNSNIDYIDITRDALLPAFDQTNPMVLTQGRLNMNGWQGSNNTNSTVFGSIGAGVQIDMVRGDLYFSPGSTLNGVVRAHTAPAGGTSFIRSTSNGATADSVVGGTGRIELGRSLAANGPEDMEIRGTEILNSAAAQAPLHTHAGEIRIVNDGINNNLDATIRSERNNDSERTARVAASKVVLEPGAAVQFNVGNSVPLTVSEVTLQGDGTIDTTSSLVTLTNVNAGSKTVTLQGTAAPTFTNPITAGNLVVAGMNITVSAANISGGVTASKSAAGLGGNVTVSTNIAGGLTVDGSIATASGDVGGGTTVTRGSANLSGDVAGGLNVTLGAANFHASGGTNTVSGPVNLDGGTINVTNGTIDFGSTVIASTPTTFAAGLSETRITGTVGLGAVPTILQNGNGGIQLDIRGANAASLTPELYVYTGQFFDADGLFTFAEQFDDNVQIVIDGTVVLRSNSGTSPWTTITSTSATGGLIGGTGVIEAGANSGTPKLNHDFGMGPNSDGWHNIEVRLYNGSGGGGAGTGQGWTAAFGLGLNVNGTSSLLGTDFIKPVDSGNATLFRTTASSNINVATASTLQAGGMTNAGTVNLAGTARVKLNGTGAAVSSSADGIAVASGATAKLEITRAGDSLTIQNLNLSGALEYTGAGNLVVNGSGSGNGSMTVNAPGGAVIVNGSITGALDVAAGALKGTGSIAGAVTFTGGTLSPGNTAGTLTTGALSLSADTTSQFELTLGNTVVGGVNDLVVVNGDLTLDGTLAISLVGAGSLLGGNQDNYVLFDFSGTLTNNGLELAPSFLALYPAAQIVVDTTNTQVLISVPEPSTAAALIGGLASLAGLQRFRRRRA